MDEWIKIIKGLQSQIDKLQRQIELSKVAIPSDGYLIVRRLPADPVSPVDGEVWYNTTSKKYKGCEDGIVKIFTTS